MTKQQNRRITAFVVADGLCCYCGVYVPLEAGALDHVIPRSKGGRDALFNRVWSCGSCNTAKGDQLPGLIQLVLVETARAKARARVRAAARRRARLRRKARRRAAAAAAANDQETPAHA